MVALTMGAGGLMNRWITQFWDHIFGGITQFKAPVMGGITKSSSWRGSLVQNLIYIKKVSVATPHTFTHIYFELL